MKSDPPGAKEIKSVQRFIDERLKAMARRVKSEKFTMSFGSGGTVTALADTDARLTGEPRAGALSVLRRSRLKAVLHLLQSESVSQRASMIAGDPKRADIIVAGGMVLHALMTQLELDYLFVSNRGLRDGLMVHLLQDYYLNPETFWSEDGRPETLEQIGEKYHHDAPHAYHVSHLALSLFFQLQELHKLPEKYAGILHGAALLHDIGLFISYPKHHKHSYYLIKSSGPNAYSKVDLDLVANISRYHRKAHPSPKHLPFSQLSPVNQEIVRKLSALLRVADGMDRRHESRVKDVSCVLPRSKTLTLKLSGTGDLKVEVEGAKKKSKLLNEVFNVETLIQGAP
jgi:exopolyphosphatase/guanosine-5'-triphosphate,3'-diphosphate pyrophosphatase